MEAEERGKGIESGCMGSWGRAGNTPVLGVFSKKELEVIPLVSSSTENLKDHFGGRKHVHSKLVLETTQLTISDLSQWVLGTKL